MKNGFLCGEKISENLCNLWLIFATITSLDYCRNLENNTELATKAQRHEEKIKTL
jgi:hypothetical protein